MYRSQCCSCCQYMQLSWEEAFDRYGLMVSDGIVEIQSVVDTLVEAGYGVTVLEFEPHIRVISQIQKWGIKLIPRTVEIGYDNPRGYLPRKIIRLLDKKFLV